MSKIDTDSDMNSEIKVSEEVLKPNLLYHYPLYLISLITGLSGIIDLRNYRAKNSLGHRIYSIILVFLIFGGSILSARGRFLYVYQYLLQTVRINDSIQQILLTFSTCYAILNSVVVCGPKTMNNYFEKLIEIDSKLCSTMDLRNKKFQSHIRFAFFHLVIILISIGDYLAWTYTMGFSVWKYFGFRLFMFYINLLIVLQLTTFTCALHTRFLILNERLIDSFLHWTKFFDPDKKRQLKSDLCPSSLTISFAKFLPLKVIIAIHDNLCDLLDVVNHIFGYNIFLLVSNIIINCVMSMNTILIFATGVQRTQNQGSDGPVLILNAAWALFFIGMGINITWSCTYCVNEALRTATLSYKLLNMVSAASESKEDRDMRTELMQLAQQVQYRKPCFSAAGFFEVNHALMHAIMGAIASYIVIVIQFNNSPIPIYNNSTSFTQNIPYLTKSNQP